MSQKTPLLLSVGEYLHIYNRGVNRERIFYTEGGYRLFMDLMAKSLMREFLSIHSFCLMPNHFHMIIRQEVQYAASKFVKSVCEPFSKIVNKWLHRHGHLFEERFRAKHIHDRSHLLQVSRYIHMNPVEARLVDSPLSWEFSSCVDYCGKRASKFLTTDVILSEVGGFDGYARFLQKCRDGYGEEIVHCLIDWDRSGS